MARPRLQLPDMQRATRGADAPPRGSVGAQVYADLRNAVLDCTLRPGTALSEQAVSERVGVSRAPVREAFRRLTGEGLLEVYPQRGSYVSRLSRVRIADAIFVREAIECRAAELAAAAPLRERKALQAILDRQVQAAEAGDFGEHLGADEDLHHRILLLAGHPYAWEPLKMARGGMNRIRHLAIPELSSHRSAIEQHARVVAAIVRGQKARSVTTMRDHIRAPLQYVEQIYRRAPEFFAE